MCPLKNYTEHNSPGKLMGESIGRGPTGNPTLLINHDHTWVKENFTED